jgi:predicted nucleic acid-binding protein
MKIVVDANVIISAAIVDGKTREIIQLGNATFLAPPELGEEVRSYVPLIAEKANLREEDVRELLDLLFESIGTVSYGIPKSAMRKAREAIGDEDPDDVPYLATSIAVSADGIWSDDEYLTSSPMLNIIQLI